MRAGGITQRREDAGGEGAEFRGEVVQKGRECAEKLGTTAGDGLQNVFEKGV
jgi:hypothetical protein